MARPRHRSTTCSVSSTHAARLATLAGLPPDEVEILRLASQLHDIGKVGIPDAIVLKPRLLTDDERLIMQGHTETGFKMLEGSDSPLLRLGSIIALSHHERFDGNGYPHGWPGHAIPLEARIVAIADVFDALRSKRPYKRAYSHEGIARDPPEPAAGPARPRAPGSLHQRPRNERRKVDQC